MDKKLRTPVSVPNPIAGTRNRVSGGAMPHIGRARPDTSRSVTIMITPIALTRITVMPSSGSIGAAWVCMCSMPCCQSRTYWANQGSSVAARWRRRGQIGAEDHQLDQ